VSNPPEQKNVDNDKPAVTLPGVVEKLAKPIHPNEPEKAQITIQGADAYTGRLGLKMPLRMQRG
jgi:hypothetical protein